MGSRSCSPWFQATFDISGIKSLVVGWGQGQGSPLGCSENTWVPCVPFNPYSSCLHTRAGRLCLSGEVYSLHVMKRQTRLCLAITPGGPCGVLRLELGQPCALHFLWGPRGAACWFTDTTSSSMLIVLYICFGPHAAAFKAHWWLCSGITPRGAQGISAEPRIKPGSAACKGLPTVSYPF